MDTGLKAIGASGGNEGVEVGARPSTEWIIREEPDAPPLAAGPNDVLGIVVMSGHVCGAAECSAYLGLDAEASGLIGWDVFDAVLTAGDLILLIAWRGDADAAAFEHAVKVPEGARIRRVRIIRDYGMFDRREAPQYYPPVEREEKGA